MIVVRLQRLLATQRARLSNFAILLLANVLIAGVGFITTVTIANAIGSERFGQLAYALAVGGIVTVNVRFGMDRSLLRDLAHYPKRFNEILAASLLARGLLLVVWIVALLVLMAIQIKGIDISWGMFLVVLATALMPMQIANVFDFWECQGRHALYLCAQRSVYFGLIWSVLFLAPGRLGLVSIGSALLAATVVFLFLQYRFALRRLKPALHTVPLRRVGRTALGLLASNKWLWLASLATLGMTALNKVLLKQFSGFSNLGVYAASFQFFSAGMLLLRNVARIGQPILARRTTPGAANARASVTLLTVYLAAGGLVVAAIALPVIAMPKLILNSLFTAEYTGEYWTLRFIGICLLFQVFDLFLGQYLTLVRMDKTFLVGAVVSGLISLASCMVLVPLYSATGAALALLVGVIAKSAFFVLATIIHIRELAVARTELSSGDRISSQFTASTSNSLTTSRMQFPRFWPRKSHDPKRCTPR